MTVDELLEHADRLEAELHHKEREIQGLASRPSRKEILIRQSTALRNRVGEIRRQCAVLQVREAVRTGNAVLAA